MNKVMNKLFLTITLLTSVSAAKADITIKNTTNQSITIVATYRARYCPNATYPNQTQTVTQNKQITLAPQANSLIPYNGTTHTYTYYPYYKSSITKQGSVTPRVYQITLKIGTSVYNNIENPRNNATYEVYKEGNNYKLR